MADTITFRVSRLRLLTIIAFCGFAGFACKAMIGLYGVFEALGNGGISGKSAFAFLIFSLPGSLCFLGLFVSSRTLEIDRRGIVERTFTGTRSFRWSDIGDVAKGGALMRRALLVETPQGIVQIADGMGRIGTIMRTIEEQRPTGKPGARKGGGGRRIMFGTRPA